MNEFPRTMIEGLSVCRLIVGVNWFLGHSHISAAKDKQILELMTRERIADIVEVFMEAGVDTLMSGGQTEPYLHQAIADAEQRTGRKCIRIATPTLNVAEGPEALAENERILDEHAALGASICMPHRQCTDAMIDVARRVTNMEKFMAMIRQRDMIPGLSTHMPEAVIYADQTGLDVATYIQVYNAAGFFMQLEADWAQRIIQEAAKPVITVKPLAAGRLIPLVGLAFSWATIRDRDMVTIGTMSPDEAREVIEISLSILEKRATKIELQWSRSKESVQQKQ